MRISWTWLGAYVDLDDLSPEDVGEQLTLLGLELDGIEHGGGGLDGIVVARIDGVEKHPNADRLNLCDVDAGAHGQFRIVCGAPGVEAGMRVPLALEGTVMPSGMEVRRVKIRGQSSSGMLCSERELGLSHEHGGLMSLGEKAEPGQPVVQHLVEHAPDKLAALHRVILDLSITPNRGDCLSHVGVAREVAAANGRALRVPASEVAPTSGQGATASVEVEDSTGCAQYQLTVLRGVKVGPSPAWLRRAVEAGGARSINNVVDVTNYVAFELGHPQHAFDLNTLGDGRVVVRRARAGEQLEAINHQTYVLEGDDLIIADATEPVAIAGVMGGAATEVGAETRDIALECAWFDPTLVRRTARRLGLHSESSHRFERGVDRGGIARATRRAIELILATQGEDASGVIVEPTVDVCPRPVEPTQLTLRLSRVNRLLGTRLSSDAVAALLTPLGVATTPAGDDELRATVPTWRSDLEREVDLIEEVARCHGLPNIDAVLPEGALGYEHRERTQAVTGMPRPGATLVTRHQLEREALLSKRLRDHGLHESVHFSFIDPAQNEVLGFDSEDIRVTPVALRNPMSVEQSVMRTSLVPGLLAAVARNQAQQAETVGLFEIGSVFWRSGVDSVARDEGVIEPTMLGVALWGARAGHWSAGRAVGSLDVWDLKGIVEAIDGELGGVLEVDESTDEVAPWLHPGVRASVLYEGRAIGAFGEVHPRVVAATSGLTGPVFVAELRVDGLLRRSRAAVQVEALARFPSSSRDVALLVGPEVTYAQVSSAVESARPDLLASWRLFDVYAGKGITEGHRSIALSMVYRDPAAWDPESGRTLTDDEVNSAHESLVRSLVSTLGAERR